MWFNYQAYFKYVHACHRFFFLVFFFPFELVMLSFRIMGEILNFISC